MMKKLLFAGLLGLSAIALEGCAPLVVTGFGAGVLMAEDRRTPGTYLLDEEIELKASSRIRENTGESAHVNVTCFNRRVLLTGEVADASAKTKVEELVRAVPNVRDIQNELALGGVSGYLARSNDGYITAKVKTELLESHKVDGLDVNVDSTNGRVKLTGWGSSAAEIQTAGQLARNVEGVKSVDNQLKVKAK